MIYISKFIILIFVFVLFNFSSVLEAVVDKPVGMQSIATTNRPVIGFRGFPRQLITAGMVEMYGNEAKATSYAGFMKILETCIEFSTVFLKF